MNTQDCMRTVRFRPYRKGMGPTFTLKLYYLPAGRCANTGQEYIGYCLTAHAQRRMTVLFEGEDFGCSPLHGLDSDDCVKALMGFLTLRPGDTDREYFAKYTPVQMEYCSEHAEALSAEVYNRFGE